MSLYRRGGKRALDTGLVLLSLPFSLPVVGLVAILVRRRLGSPVIFAQDRPGKDGKVFRLYKFRSMTDEKDANGELLPDDVRLTRFGRLLRSTSLDELPELYNVVRGEMALVGPRPLLVRYLERYNPRQRRRHEVRPGITGLAQVRGRNNLSWPDRLEMDVQYAENYSMLLDLQILLETFGKVVRRADIAEDGHATKAEFTGDENG